MKAGSPTYLLHDGNNWFVYVHGVYGDRQLYVDGAPAQLAPGTDRVQDRWYVVDHKPEQMDLRTGPKTRTVAYRLPEGTQIEGLPRELTADEFKERFPRDDDFDYIDPRGKLYEAITEDYTPEPEPIETPTLVLEGEPADYDDERDWVADLPYELRYRPEYRHLFPGYLVDFDKALLEQIKKVPGVNSAYEARAGEPLKVYYNLRYWPKARRGKTLGGKKGTFQSVMKSLELRPPRRIDGANRAEAEAKWDAETEVWLSKVREATDGCVCETCGGEFKPADDREAVSA